VARRRALMFGLASTLTVGSFFACTFPDPTLYTLLEPEAGTPDAENGLDAWVEPATDAESDASTPPDEPIPGVHEGGAPPEFDRDAGAPIDASACDDANCDCDGDGYLRAECNPEPSMRDCDDHDTRYTPAQGFLDIKPDPGKNGDWNCDGKVERYFTVNEKCSGLLSNCDGREGFEGNPGCGEEGKYVFCKTGGLLGLGCEEDKARTQTRVQACR